MKQPLVLSLVSITAAISLVFRIIGIPGALLALMQNPVATDFANLGGLLVDAFASALAATALWATHTRPRGAFFLILLFPLLGFFVYPVQSFLSTVGYYPPPPRYENDQLLGAAAVELSRLAMFFTLLLWLILSQSSRVYLKRESIPHGSVGTQ